MDWSKIKTIFIITFLLLDTYLMYEFFKIRDAYQLDVMTQASIDEKIKSDKIEYVELPKEVIKDRYLSAKSKVFAAEELLNLKNQSLTVIDGSILQSNLKEPVKLDVPLQLNDLTKFVQEYVLYSDQYRLWAKTEKPNTIVFYQHYQEKIFYENMSGKLTLFLNSENEVISYEQTLLIDVEEFSDKEEVIAPLSAIETLFERGMLAPKSKITDVELGYFTLVQLTASQVLSPTWHFVVNDKEHFFVNALEGQIIQLNTKDNKIME